MDSPHPSDSRLTRRAWLRSAASVVAVPVIVSGQATMAPPAPVAPSPPKPLAKISGKKKAPAKPPEKITLPPIQPGAPYLQAGPQLGHISDQSAHVWIRATATLSWKVRYWEKASPDITHEVIGSPLDIATTFTGMATLGGLKPDQEYHYQVVLGDREQLSMPLPSLRTASSLHTPGRLRIAFGSCVGRSPEAAAPTWAELAARRDLSTERGAFDLLLMLGDNHYADTNDVETQRIYYTAHRMTAGWRELAANRPVYAIWDDHDFGPNNSDGTQPGKENALQVYQEYWPSLPVGQPGNPGCYHTFTRGQVQFFMLDCRYHRSPNTRPDGPDKTMLGAAQLAWLKQELFASKAKIKILATGSEWETFSSEDSWKMFRHERDPLFQWIDEQGIEGIILLSGDRHFSAGYHVLGRFLELTAGPFGSANAKLRTNPERFTGYDTGRLWGILDIDTTAAIPVVAFEFWQAGSGLLERREITWEQLHGRGTIALSPSLEPPTQGKNKT